MTVIYAWTPVFTDTGKKGRQVLGTFLHDTEGHYKVDPYWTASWHYEIDRDGAIYQFVDEADIAYHVRACDRYWPPWLPHAGKYNVSRANEYTIGIELVSDAAYRAAGVPYTDAQYNSLRWLLADIYTRHPSLPIETHGRVQLDRSDPVQLDFGRAGLVASPNGSFVFTPTNTEEDVVIPATDDEIKTYLEQLGTGINPATAIFARAALSYRRGETRGPAISDEYSAQAPDGRAVVHQKFTAGIGEYDPTTGQATWVEAILHPEP